MSQALAQLGAGLRAGLGSVKPSKVDKAKTRRVNRGRADKDWFFHYYLPHWFSLPSAQVHHDINRAASSPKTTVIRAPRDHAKSMTAVAGDIVYNLCYGLTTFSVLIRATQPEADDDVDMIRCELESNERIREDFGDLYDPRRWSRRGFVTSKGQLVIAKSRGGKIRGIRFKQFRPDHLYVDDPDDDESVATKEQREKTLSWFRRSVVPAPGPKGVIKIIGTVLHRECLVEELARNPLYDQLFFQAITAWPERMDLWESFAAVIRDGGEEAGLRFYAENQAAMDKGGTVLWPERYSLLRLMLRRMEIGSVAFAQEYQNTPRDDESSVIKEAWLHTFEPAAIAGLPMRVYVACDPATGKRGARSKSCIVVIGVCGRFVYVLDVFLGHITPLALVERLYTTWRVWKPLALAIEGNGYQTVLKDLLQDIAAKRNAVLPVTEKIKSIDKLATCQHVATFLENGLVFFAPSQVEAMNQLLYFRRNDDPFDVGDTLDMCLNLSNEAGGPIEFASTGEAALSGVEAYV